MKRILVNETGVALISVMLAVSVISILFTSIMALQVNEMKAQKKFEEHIIEIHRLAGKVESKAFDLLSSDNTNEFLLACNNSGENEIKCEANYNDNPSKITISAQKGTTNYERTIRIN